MGAISAGADTSKDLKPIARRASYGTSAATVAVISSSPSRGSLKFQRWPQEETHKELWRRHSELVGGTQTRVQNLQTDYMILVLSLKECLHQYRPIEIANRNRIQVSLMLPRL